MNLNTEFIISTLIGLLGIAVSVFFASKKKVFKNMFNPKKVKDSTITYTNNHVGDNIFKNTKE